jgi:uncharacterized protein
MFQHVITTEAQLRDLMGQASEGAIKKETDYLTDECIAYIARSPFMLLATSSKDGRCDVSPKGDPNGFVKVLDSRHIVIPDRPGNRGEPADRADLPGSRPPRDTARQRPRLDHERS